MNGTYIKLGIGVMLFLTWVAFVAFKVTGAEDIITAIKIALVGLGAYHLNNDQSVPPAVQAPPPEPSVVVVPPNAQSGFGRPLCLLVAALLAGCAGLNIQWVASYSTVCSGNSIASCQPPVIAMPAIIQPAQAVPAK